METEYERSRIEKAKRSLFDPDGQGLHSTKESRLSPTHVDVSTDFDDISLEKTVRLKKVKPKEVRYLKILVVLAVLSAIFSVAYMLYQYYDESTRPSPNNIQIAFEMPVGVTPGIPADITVIVANYNKVALNYANLVVTFPSGARDGDTPDKDLLEEKRLFGKIEPGQIVKFLTRVSFLGEENEDKNIKALLDFSFEGMSSSFTKSKDRSTHMLAAPVNLTVNVLKEVNSGQTLELSIRGVSNTVIPLKNMLVKVEYPLGFSFTDADPKPTSGNNIWHIDTLERGAKFSIKVRGVLSGDASQIRVFRSELGERAKLSEREIATGYGLVISPVTVKSPFIGIGLTIGGKSAEDAVVPFGTDISGQIDWKNNLPDRVTNAQIELRLKGITLDRTSVKPINGYYRSIDETIIWDERTQSELALLESGKSGSLSFNFAALPPAAGNQLITNPVILAEVTVSGKRMSEAGVPEKIYLVSTQNVKISSLAQFAGRAVYFVGPFTNTGPIPPKAEKETTYTIIWSIANTSNTITKARVVGTLPPAVSWLGSVSPSGEDVTYDATTNRVTWLPGDIVPGAGAGNPRREVAFQVTLLPSISQIGNTAVLMQGVSFSALDSFTGEELGSKDAFISTSLSTDPKAERGSGNVAK